MKSKRHKRKHPIVAAGIIERHDNHLLIALPTSVDEATRTWLFPRGPVLEDESPETGLRRLCRDKLAVSVEVVVGQPPLLLDIEETQHEVRFFFCGVVSGEAQPGSYQEIRWVPRGHLREYDFDAVSQPVVEWLLETAP